MPLPGDGNCLDAHAQIRHAKVGPRGILKRILIRMRHSLSNPLLALVILWALLPSIGCHRKGQVAIAPATPPTGPVLGFVKAFIPNVVCRRSQQLEWNEVVPGLPLYAYDAVQTHSGATAKLELINQSEIEMESESLVILDPSALSNAAHRDRAVVRSGVVQGTTRNELWILTSAALVKMKAKKGGRARGVVAVAEGKKLNIELKEGTAIVLQKKPGAPSYEVADLAPDKPMILDAPVGKETIGSGTADWAPELASIEPGEALPPVKSPSPARSAAPKAMSEAALKQELGRVVHEHVGEVRSCYEKLAGIEGAPEKVVVSFVIAPSGRVKSVATKNAGVSPKLEECLISHVSQWKFPPGQVEVAVSYPFLFRDLGRD